MKKLSVLIILLAVSLTSCTPGGTPYIQTDTPIAPTDTQTPRQTVPTNTPTSTPEPTPFSGVYKGNNISFTYPLDWRSAELVRGWIAVASKQEILNDPSNWKYSEGDVGVVVTIADLGKQSMGNQIYALDQYTLFSNIEMPDKEPVHMVSLGGKEFAIGTYSKSYINSNNGGVPLFIAMYYSKQSTITIEMYAPPDDETQLQKVFEDILTSIETIPVVETSYALQPFEPMLILDVNQISGWIEPLGNQKVYSDGVCRWFEDNQNKNRTLNTCVLSNSQYTNLATIRKQYSSTLDTFIDLESLTKYKYNQEFDLYAYQGDDGKPSFLLALENHDLLHTIEMKIQPFQQGLSFSSGVTEQFGDEIDGLLHDVAIKMLERSKYPFDPELLIAANGLANWKEPNYGYQFQKAYSDGICRSYSHRTNSEYNLDNCVFYTTDHYNLNSIKETFQNGDTFIDLQEKSKYAYDYDFVFYGLLRGGYPTYILYLEKEGFLYNAEIIVLQYHDKTDSKAISDLFNDEVDSTLHEVITKNLENFQ